jgi:RimJ/RimL family protein N-acetyltransferase
MSAPTSLIETLRLQLRRFEMSDADEVAQYHSLPEVQRYLDVRTYNASDVKLAVAQMRNQHRLHRPGDALSLAVIRKADDALLGQLSLRWTDATAGQAELKVVIAPTYRRQGYASEVAGAALDLGFGQLGFHRVFARCSARSEGAMQLLKGLGMRLEAHFREHALFQGDWDEELHFAMLDREWLRGRKVKELSWHNVA